MGFLSKIFGTDPEALERKGDAYFANESWGPAKVEYEKALDGLASGPPEAMLAAGTKGWSGECGATHGDRSSSTCWLSGRDSFRWDSR